MGIHVDRYGMANCPFHDDSNPSLKLDSRFHCFGCGADGNLIEFVSRYHGIPWQEAAQRISDEFGIDVKDTDYEKKEKIDYKDIKFNILNYLIYLEKENNRWIEEYRPEPGDEELHFLFVTAVQNTGYVSYLIDTLFNLRKDEEIKEFLEFHKGEVLI